jgi:hypothetical protein
MRVDEIINADGTPIRPEQTVLVEVPNGLSSQLPLTGAIEPAECRSIQDNEISYYPKTIAVRPLTK